MSRYKIGYKKPPLHSRFMKGKSGNPKGRPKKDILNTMETIQKEMERKITIRDAEGSSRITMEQAIIRQLVHKAAKGDITATKYVLDLYAFQQDLESLISPPQFIICTPPGPIPPMPPIFGWDETKPE